MKETLRAAMYGLAIGDALGVPYEFKNRDTFECTGMTGGGTWGQPAGTWSDDTSMTLATLDSLNACRGVVSEGDMQNRFLDWRDRGLYAVDGKVFDIGNTTSQALEMGWGIDREDANGNGSLMRILPLAFAPCGFWDVQRASAITHAHWMSCESCVIYVGIAKELLEGADIDMAVIHWAQKEYSPFDRLAPLLRMRRDDIVSDGFVIHTLEAALWCLLHTHSYEDAVLTAVNLGGDTDTTAAVTGGLAGILYGLEDIPVEWVEALRNRGEIDRLVDSASWLDE